MLIKPSPILVADRFPALLEGLLEVLEPLSEEQWAFQTAADGWSVKDVALHLLGDEIGILSGRRDGFQEPVSPFDDWGQLVGWIDQRNTLWVQATRRISSSLLVDLLRYTGEQTNLYFRSIDPYAPGREVSWAGAGPAPTWLEIAREFTERWHHQQHIREAVDKPGGTEPFFLGPVLAAFVYALPRTFQVVNSAEGSCVTLEINGRSGGVWTVRREERKWVLYRGKARSANAAVVLGEDDAWRLFTRGITPEEARARAAFTGDPYLAEILLHTTSIIA